MPTRQLLDIIGAGDLVPMRIKASRTLIVRAHGGNRNTLGGCGTRMGIRNRQAGSCPDLCAQREVRTANTHSAKVATAGDHSVRKHDKYHRHLHTQGNDGATPEMGAQQCTNTRGGTRSA